MSDAPDMANREREGTRWVRVPPAMIGTHTLTPKLTLFVKLLLPEGSARQELGRLQRNVTLRQVTLERGKHPSVVKEWYVHHCSVGLFDWSDKLSQPVRFGCYTYAEGLDGCSKHSPHVHQAMSVKKGECCGAFPGELIRPVTVVAPQE